MSPTRDEGLRKSDQSERLICAAVSCQRVNPLTDLGAVLYLPGAKPPA